MERIELTKDLSFSRIIHGWWRAESWNNSSEENLALIEECLKLGITTFDHADIYGGYTTEELLRNAFSEMKKKKKKIQLITKCGICMPSDKKNFPLKIG